MTYRVGNHQPQNTTEPIIDVKADVIFQGIHSYWSTHCRHHNHDACKATEHAPGVPRSPACCKTCGSPCICPCHLDAAAELGLDEDAPKSPLRSTQTNARSIGVSESTPDSAKPAEIESGRFDVWGEENVDGGWLEMACNTCRAWSPEVGTDAGVTDLAELVQRATQHAEVCK